MSGPTARLPSLGDASTQGYKRMRFVEPRPEGREGLLKTFARVISQGLVQKVVVEIGQDIVYERLVKDDGTSEDLDHIESDDLFGAIRNSEIVDFRQKGESFFHTLFLAMRFISAKALGPKAFVCSNWELLRRLCGLGEMEDIDELFGVKTYEHEEIPDDVLVLVAASPMEPDLVVLSLRIPLDPPEMRALPAIDKQRGRKVS
jgi:hypothetical protein